MPSSIALLFSMIFVLLLINIEIRLSQATIASIFPTIWFLHGTSRGISFWLGIENKTSIDFNYLSGNPLERNFLIIIMLISIYIIFIRKLNILKLIKNNKFFFILLVYLAFSSLWSPYPNITLKRWFRVIGDFLVISVFLTEPHPFESFKQSLRITGYVLIPLSILCIKYFRDIGISYTYDGLTEMWVGIASHKNELGRSVSMIAILYLFDFVTTKNGIRKLLSVILLFMSVYLLSGSPTAVSKTAFVIFILGSIILLFGRFRYHLGFYRSNILRYTCSISALMPFLVIIATSTIIGPIAEFLGRDATLTGRTDLWREILFLANKNPFWGQGYGSFWIGNIGHNLWDIFNWMPTQAHNGYLDIYLETGIIGIILLVMIIIVFLNRSKKDIYIIDNILQLTLLTIILLNNITESSLLRGSTIYWSVFVALILVKVQNNNYVYYN